LSPSGEDHSAGAGAILAEPPYPLAHWEATRRALSWAIGAIPLYAAYAGRLAEGGSGTIGAADLQDAASTRRLLMGLPILSKQDIRLHFPKRLLPEGLDWRAAVARNEAVLVATSGTTDERLQLLWEAGWWERQERAGLSLNRGVGRVLAGEYREAVLTSPLCSGLACHAGPSPLEERLIDNLLFLNHRGDPTYWTDADVRRMVEELNAFQPDGIEADPAYLAELSRRIRRLGLEVHQPSYVTLSYEFVSGLHRREIASVFRAPLLDLYGSTEAGVLFMQCEEGCLHHNERYSHVELVPSGLPGAPAALARLLVTTLESRFTPLVRYDIGDLVVRSDAPCRCGVGEGWVLRSIEGRVKDVTVATRGDAVTVGAVDRELSQTRGLVAYQLVQEVDRYVVRYVAEEDSKPAIAGELRSRTRALYGEDAVVECSRERFFVPEASGKFRLAYRRP
jgi:phenylacetate-CoA ligase